MKERQNFPDKQKVKDFLTNGSLLQETLKKFYKLKWKDVN